MRCHAYGGRSPNTLGGAGGCNIAESTLRSVAEAMDPKCGGRLISTAEDSETSGAAIPI